MSGLAMAITASAVAAAVHKANHQQPEARPDMLTPLQTVIAAELRKNQPRHHGSKLGYHMAITAVANALSVLDPQLDRKAFIEAASPPDIKARQLPLQVTV